MSKKTVDENISKFGYHTVLVQNGVTPRYIYTIGLAEKIGCELVFAGGIWYDRHQVATIISGVRDLLSENNSRKHALIKLEKVEQFELVKVDRFWNSNLFLGFETYYGNFDQVNLLQILPIENRVTFETPYLAEGPNFQQNGYFTNSVIERNGVSGRALTPISVLLETENVLEVCRWEADYWEMYPRDPNQYDKNELRIVPIWMLLDHDRSLEPALRLKVKQGIWRKEIGANWNEWE